MSVLVSDAPIATGPRRTDRPHVLASPPRERARPALRTIRVGLLGCGTVGQAFVRQCTESRERLARQGLHVRITASLVRHGARTRPSLSDAVRVTDDADEFCKHAF